jgi:hypothetical protein
VEFRAAVTFPAALLAVPVVPGSDDARRLAQEELAKAAYRNARPGAAEQLWDWLSRTLRDFLAGLTGPDAGVGLALLAAGIFLVLAVTAWFVRPRLNRRRTLAGSGDGIFGSSPVLADAAAHRLLAAQSATSGDFGAAVTEAFRALVRSAEERDILPAAPGRTADEAAALLRSAFPGHGAALSTAAGHFDAVRYGGDRADSASYEQMRGLEAALNQSQPALAGIQPAPLAVPR